MAQSSFSAQVSAWAAKSEARMTAVFRDAAQSVAEDVKKTIPNGGKMPIDTGFLRASLMASTAQMPTLDDSPEKDKSYPDDNAQIELVIAGAQLGQTIYLGFTAVYARRLEYGFTGTDSLGRTYNQQGLGFVRKSAQKWPLIVKESATKIKARVNSRASASR